VPSYVLTVGDDTNALWGNTAHDGASERASTDALKSLLRASANGEDNGVLDQSMLRAAMGRMSHKQIVALFQTVLNLAPDAGIQYECKSVHLKRDAMSEYRYTLYFRLESISKANAFRGDELFASLGKFAKMLEILMKCGAIYELCWKQGYVQLVSLHSESMSGYKHMVKLMEGSGLMVGTEPEGLWRCHCCDEPIAGTS
jgi:hypothetical protein